MLSKLAVKRPVTMIMALVAILVLGSVSLIGLPQALMPDIDYPYALAMVTYPGAGPEEIDSLITEPMEESFASVEGMKNMISMTSEGASIVMMEFEMKTDMNFATLEMREKLSLVQNMFPEEASAPTIMKLNLDSLPVMQIYAYSDKDTAELASYLEDNIIPRFERISGVAAVDMVGSTEAQITVDFDQDKLTGYGLTMSTVASLLQADNVSLPSGTVKNGSQEVIVRTYGEFESVSEISNMPVPLADGSVITLKDIAAVSLTESEPESVSRLDGQKTIGLSISKASDANIVELSDAVQDTMEKLEEEFGDEVRFVVGFDQSDFVRDSISSVGQAAVQGALLAVIIIFLFLRNFRSTLVIAISIPASVLATFALMKALGMSLNIITLGALTLAVGMLVDNSVVVLENIFRRNHMGLNAAEASVEGSREVGLAVMASTLTSVVVYLPIALSSGMAGMLFRDFCLTIIGALIISLAVSLSVVPMLSSKLLDSSVSQEYAKIGPFFYRYKLVNRFADMIESLQESYKDACHWALGKRKRVLAALVAVFVLSVSLVSLVGWELLPETDEGTFSITAELPYGTTLEDKDAFLTPIEEYCLTLPEVEHVAFSAGSSSSLLSSGSNTISVTLVDKQDRDRSTKEVMKDVKNQFRDLAGAEVTYEITSSMSMNLTGSDITVQIMGEDLDTVSDTALDLASTLESVESVSEVTTDVEEGSPEIRVILDRNSASSYGITAYQTASALSGSLSGTTATRIMMNGDTIDVILSLADDYAGSVESLKNIMVTGAAGISVPVSQIADFESDNSPVSITKQNQKVTQNINIELTEDADINEVSDVIYDMVDNYAFPDGVYYGESGLEEQIVDSFKDLLLALVVAMLLVYIVLAAQFESFILPVMVMMSIPFAMSGAFLALFLADMKLSMPAFIGLIMLVGIVVNNAILLVEFIGQNREHMGRDEAIAQAGSVRMRPILMTTMTTIISMVPMALGLGAGLELMAPMAVSVIGGLTASTLISLFVVPILYAVVDDMEETSSARRRAKKELSLYREALWLAKRGSDHEKK